MDATATPLQTTRQIDIAAQWLWLLPFAAVFYYPWALMAFHNEVIASNGFTGIALLWIISVYMVPGIGFVTLHRLGKIERPLGREIVSRRLSHLVVAAPPAFTIMGVFLYLMKVNGHDAAVWTGIWAALTILGILLVNTTLPDFSAKYDLRLYARLRVVHGLVSLFLLGVFLLPHLFNHLVGLLGIDAHWSLMKVLRALYRNGFLEPMIIAAFIFQILSGLVLFRPKTAIKSDMLDSLQTASGIYLAVFVMAHVNSVFTLARYFDIDTTYAWTVNAPTGLIMSAWDIRLLPHYSLAVFFLIAHLACGARVVMRGHDMALAKANKITWSLVAIAVIVSIAITTGMIRATLNGAS